MVDKYTKYIKIDTKYIITINKNNIYILDNIKNIQIFEYIFPCLNIYFEGIDKNSIYIKISIKVDFLIHKKSKCLLNTFYKQLSGKIYGLVFFYKSSVSIKGFNYSLDVVTKNDIRYLYFYFGLKYSDFYILPQYIFVESVSKLRVGISSYDLILLNQFKLKVQQICYPYVYKIKGIYLDDKFPKPKTFKK